MTIALATEGLGRRYRTTWGLRDCTLAVPAGTVTGLVGPNGAGKSTLLRLAAGVSRPTAGTVSVFGTPVDPNGRDHLEHIGYLDQDRPLFSNFRVGEMMEAGRRLNPRWDAAAAARWIAELEIPTNRRIGRLSGGQRAQVAMVACFAKRADLMLLDEPVANLDPLARRRLMQALMGVVAESGTTVVISSHIVSELEPLCDHLIVLSSSRVLVAGGTEQLLAEHRVLIGPPGSDPPPGVHVVDTSVVGRQRTFLVRGTPPVLPEPWQVLEPDLEEIVVGHMSNRGAAPDPAGGAETASGVGGGLR